MTEDTKQITADNLRADFLNATSNWQRWKVLNRALDWAVAASENADHYRQQAQKEREKGYVRHGERILSNGDHTIRAGDVVTWDGEEEGWIVRRICSDMTVEIVLLDDDWRIGAQAVPAKDLFP